MNFIKKGSMVSMVILGFVSSLFSQDIFDAVWEGNLERVKTLLKENPELLNIQSDEGYNPLHGASIMGQNEVITFFIEKGANVNIQNKWGSTPLHLAARFGRVTTIRLLVSHGADMDIVDKKGWNALRWAVYSGEKEAANQFIVKGAEFNFSEQDTESILHEAAFCGYQRLVDLILEREVDIDSRNVRGGTLLHSAAFGGLKDFAELMLQKGININERNKYGLTPLHLAAYAGNEGIVEHLIERGAVINAKGSGGKTPFHFAEEEGHRAVVELLISEGADISPRKFPMVRGDYFGQKKPGLSPEIFAPGIISTFDGYEFAGTFSADGKEFFYTYRKPGVQGNCLKYTKREGGVWMAPESAPFSFNCFEFEPHISPDGNKLYFGSRRPLPGKTEQSRTPYIWVTHKNNGRWEAPQFLGPPVSDFLPMYVTATNDGSIYFTANRERGNYKSTFQDNKFSMPERLPDEINYLLNAGHPFIAPDESYLIFDGRDVRKESDDTDIYLSFRKSDGSWTKAKNMGEGINTDSGELCASVSPDGKFLFFQSRRNGNMDIYWVDAKIIERFKPEGLN